MKGFIIGLLVLLATSACGSPPPATVTSDIVTKGPWVDSRALATLADADAYALAHGKTLLIASQYTITSPTTIYSHTQIIPGGLITTADSGSLAFAPGATLDINDGSYQVFAGTMAITGLEWATPDMFGDSVGSVQSAIDAIQTGGKLTILKTITSNPITIDKNLSVIGAQKGLNFVATDAVRIRLADNSTGALLTIGVHCRGISIKDLALDGNKAGQTVANNIIYYAPDATSNHEVEGALEHLKIINASGTGIYISSNRNGQRLYDVSVYGSAYDGIYLGSSDNLVSGGFIGGNDGNGIVIANWTNNITNNDIWDNVNGVVLSNNSAKYISIVDNHFDRNTGSSIYADNSTSNPSQISIIGNTFHHNYPSATQPTILLAADNVTAIGNKFGPMDDGSAVQSSYSIYVPNTITAGTHTIFGNAHNANADLYGVINYRGVGVPSGFVSSLNENSTFTATGTGFTTSPTGTAIYSRFDKMVMIFLPTITGTSNATTFTLTGIPASLIPSSDRTVFVRTVDNGGAVTVSLAVIKNDGSISIFKNVSAAAFTASGTKTLYNCMINYQM